MHKNEPFPFFKNQKLLARTVSGVARISKLGGTPVTWFERPMRGGVFFGGRQRSGTPSHRQAVWGRAVTTPTPQKKSHRICTNPVAMPVDGRGGRAPAPSPVATLLRTVSLAFQIVDTPMLDIMRQRNAIKALLTRRRRHIQR